MNLKSLFYSSLSILLGILIGKIIPASLGYSLADRVGRYMASRKNSSMVTALRANLSVVCGLEEGDKKLDEIVAISIRKHMKRLFEFYHNLDRPQEIDRLIKFSPAVDTLLADWNAKPFGLMIMGVHLSAFDLGMLGLTRHGFKTLTLSIPNPNGQYSKQNEIREDHGMQIIPISTSALQIARIRLQQNGMVLTGLDRPAPESRYRLKFFGQPSHLPVFYTRLALRTGVPIIVVAAHDLPDGTHRIDCSDLIWMENRADPHEEIIYNTEKVLKEAEKFISAAPEQWAMFFPVWPDRGKDIDLAKS